MSNTILRKVLLRYGLSSVFLILGLLSIRYSLKKQSNQDKLLNKGDLPTYGKGGKLHMFYVGTVLIGLAFYLYWGKWDNQ